MIKTLKTIFTSPIFYLIFILQASLIALIDTSLPAIDLSLVTQFFSLLSIGLLYIPFHIYNKTRKNKTSLVIYVNSLLKLSFQSILIWLPTIIAVYVWAANNPDPSKMLELSDWLLIVIFIGIPALISIKALTVAVSSNSSYKIIHRAFEEIRKNFIESIIFLTAFFACVYFISQVHDALFYNLYIYISSIIVMLYIILSSTMGDERKEETRADVRTTHSRIQNKLIAWIVLTFINILLIAGTIRSTTEVIESYSVYMQMSEQTADETLENTEDPWRELFRATKSLVDSQQNYFHEQINKLIIASLSLFLLIAGIVINKKVERISWNE